MNTTIQLSQKTKSDLFQLKTELEQQYGHSISFDELLQIMLDERKKYVSAPKKNALLRKLRGSLPDSAIESYQSQKRTDLMAENND